MDFEVFENFTDDEALRYVSGFLQVGRDRLPAFCELVSRDGLRADLSIGSIAGIAAWVSRRVVTLPLPPDPDLPHWIRDSEEYLNDNFDFDEASKSLILRLAFYYGESFVRTYEDRLSWAVGDRDTAPQGQPVVTGFMHGLQLPVLMVAENVVARLITEGEGARVPAMTVAKWASDVPPRSA